MIGQSGSRRRHPPKAGRVWVPPDMLGGGYVCTPQTWRAAARRDAAARTSRGRLLAASGLFALCFAVLALRLVSLAMFSDGTALHARVAAQAAPPRAEIVDRNGVLLATNLATASLYADARHVLDPGATTAQLLSVLPDLDPALVRKRLSSGRAFVWLKRNLTPRQQIAVNNLGLPGLGFLQEERRVYPLGRLAAHVVGFVDIDNKGLSGMEKALDARLRGPAAEDEPVALSLDVRVQHVLRDELRQGVEEFNAIGATGIVLDVQSGEILAMSSLPDFDPNAPGEATVDARFNRATLGVYEMGSTFKAFTVAMALESGAARINSIYDATQPIKIGRFRIRDYHAEARPLSVPEIFVHSSNIGAAKMALDVGAERQQEFFRRFGMMAPVAVELPERGAPLVPAQWREINTMTIAFGHGMAVTPLHVAAGMAAIVNGGILPRPTLLRRDSGNAPDSTRILSPETSVLMRGLLRLVVADKEGTGKKADVEGYLVGGKTGTAEKAAAGGYRRKALLTSFVAAFPGASPRYVVVVMLDEPKGNAKTYGFATAGWTAAPVAGRVIARIAPLLGVPPVPPTDSDGGASALFVSLDR